MTRASALPEPKLERMFAGISVPDTPIVTQAMEYARERCEPYLFNHVARSWLFAARLGQIRSIEHGAEVVAVWTVLHDITLNERFNGRGASKLKPPILPESLKGIGRRRAPGTADLGQSRAELDGSIDLFKEAEVARCTASICLGVIGWQLHACQHRIGQLQ